MRNTLISLSLFLSSFLLTIIGLQNLDVIHSSWLAKLLDQEVQCSNDQESVCYFEQNFQGEIQSSQLQVADTKLDISDLGESFFQIGEQKVRVLMPAESKTDSGTLYFSYDLNTFLANSLSAPLCIKGRYLQVVKKSQLNALSIPHEEGEQIVELYRCDVNSFQPSIFTLNLINGGD